MRLLKHSSRGSGDIVNILREARSVDSRFDSFHVRASLGVKKAFGLTMRQAHFVAGWLAGEVTDEELRAAVPEVLGDADGL